MTFIIIIEAKKIAVVVVVFLNCTVMVGVSPFSEE